MEAGSPGKKKILENPIIGSLVVPVAIILVGALIIFGVTKMLSSDRSYKDLVRELHSKTFGNRWVAAYELSKLISTSSIPEEDIPWLVGNLDELYKSAQDARTRDFIVVAMGALKSDLSIPVLTQAISDSDPNVRFHAVIALSENKLGVEINKNLLLNLLNLEDEAVKQAAIFTLAMHNIPEAEEKLVKLHNSSSVSIRYAAATGLISYRNDVARETLEEILSMSSRPSADAAFSESKVIGLKMNILKSLRKTQWNVLNELIERLIPVEQNLGVVSEMRETVNQLKKR
ncbi:MAG: hypothetical protein COW01_00830 [Bdellovibrionales bacterium CG12_big_fil_rev_8_21_14_0_65_38_15]|nr:MAG: hypothetical protein COW79_05090 [Bdellovibrionales bacterium CG22_combo_CG10-13_8_21_14_all_38_13]PIQ57301.1 MAG: hypothetical protein COW01_00830 [Bdellovibrionales bacterium CG12_big_fil_rev_8_21_14_0_65_38_15]PIR28847.1 MAG: hypothetical protein COV38_13420 [Bdellovibrionales bacterium CG11_big_fil_rev_8_21_14_0_20_38_13]